MNPRMLRWPGSHTGGRGVASAWAIAIGFSAIAALSFAVDQALTLSPAAATEGRIEIQPLPIGETLNELSPLPLIQSVMDAAFEPSTPPDSGR